jgi:hypothetical protein
MPELAMALEAEHGVRVRPSSIWRVLIRAGMSCKKSRSPHRHAGTQTLIAGLRYDRLFAPWLLDGAMDRRVFETWVEISSRPVFDPVRWSSSTTSPCTEARRSPSGCAPGTPGPPSCRRTLPISIRSRWPSPSSRPTSAASARTRNALRPAVGEICDLFDPDEF